MRYVGIDLHAQHFSIAVLENDGFAFEATMPTSPENLRDAMDAIAGPKTVVFEESTLAAWAHRTLLPHAEHVIVSDPCQNRWIGNDEKLDDEEAARKLAQLMRGGFIHPVHHADEGRQAFKELVLLYHQTTREVTRFKNRVKAKFRQHGVRCTGTKVYHPQHRDEWLAKLQAPGVDFQAASLLSTVDHLTEQKKSIKRRITQRAKQHSEIGRFQEVPGVGIIGAVTFFAIVDDPYRFATRGKLWTYCGLGLARRKSDQMTGPEHLNQRGNRYLKAMAKTSGLRATNLGNNRFSRQYERLTANHQPHAKAWLTVSRAIVNTLDALWRTGEHYRDEEHHPNDLTVTASI
jgi:transposase